MTGPDDVGSVGEEAIRLLRALGDHQRSETPATDPEAPVVGGAASEEHTCPNGWCPVCQAVSFVRDNPEIVAQVSAAGIALATSLRDLIDAALEQRKPQ